MRRPVMDWPETLLKRCPVTLRVAAAVERRPAADWLVIALKKHPPTVLLILGDYPDTVHWP